MISARTPLLSRSVRRWRIGCRGHKVKRGQQKQDVGLGLWLLGFSLHIGGALIHLLLVLSLVVLAINLLSHEVQSKEEQQSPDTEALVCAS